MPNWCDNKLTLHCKPQEYISFVKKYFDKQGDLDFNKVIPEPKRKKDCPSTYWVKPDFHVQKDNKRPWFNWYDWHCNMWGTKWNSNDTACMPIREAAKLDPNVNYDFDIWFETAWSPIIPVISALIEQCPVIFIEYCYFEGGMWFAGWMNSDNPYDNSVDDVKQFSIDEGFCSADYYDEEEEE